MGESYVCVGNLSPKSQGFWFSANNSAIKHMSTILIIQIAGENLHSSGTNLPSQIYYKSPDGTHSRGMETRTWNGIMGGNGLLALRHPVPRLETWKGKPGSRITGEGYIPLVHPS